jgi:uncharacterized protein (DUF1697 family)
LQGRWLIGEQRSAINREGAVMSDVVLLFRGINVGGKNPVAMSALRDLLEELGCSDVVTYLASGNAIVNTTQKPAELAARLEKQLPSRFTLHDDVVKVLALTPAQLRAVVSDRPKGFGDTPGEYHCDAIFLMGLAMRDAMGVFDPREGIDAVWPGKNMIYSQRLSAQRTKSRLGKIIGTLPYKSMTIRSWQTTTKLVGILDQRGALKRA